MTPEYPGHGKPCNGCGKCCQGSLCVVGASVFTTVEDVESEPVGPCPALERDGDIFRCGMMLHPERYVPRLAALVSSATLIASAKYLMSAGQGCTMEDGKRTDWDFKERLALGSSGPTIDAAARCWGLSLVTKQREGAQ